MIPPLFAVLLLLSSGPSPAPPPFEADADPAAGRRIYLEGIGAAGEPVRATVQGDVKVLGSQLACVTCHLRSGMGSSEGTRLAPPVSGHELFQSGRTPSGPRPAYTPESVAHAVTLGLGATGKPLDPLMPRYALTPTETRSLVAYLTTLSAAPSPGVSDTEISFAVVVDELADPAARKAMLDVLEGFVRQKNTQTRQQARRGQAAAGRNFDRPMYAAFREWRLRVWALRGPESGWREQLESHYEREHVFGLLSGLMRGSWREVHAFCEERAIPCILPNTDRPAVGTAGYYTRYFSGGVDLEARAVAARVASQSPAGGVAQLFRDDADGRAAASALRRALQFLGLPAPTDIPIVSTSGEAVERLARSGAGVVVAWLARGDLLPAASLGASSRAVFLSSTFLGAPPSAEETRRLEGAVLVHPFASPAELSTRLGRLTTWLASAKIPAGDPRIQDQTFFACMMAGEALMQIRTGFYREFFLERFDHGGASVSAFYPRLSFGPGQTFLSKGCYLIPLDGDGAAAPEWIVP